MAVLGWRVFYPGGVTRNSSDTLPKELPDGILGIVEYLPFDSPKRYFHTGYDWYFFWDGPRGLVIGGNSDRLEENKRRYPGAVFLRGRWTTHEHMREVREAMNEAKEPPGGS